MDGRKSNLREPFAKGVEWFDLEEGIEGYSLFPILRLELPGARPPFVIPAKAGIQRRANGKTGGKLRGNAINRNVPDLGSRFRGNDEKRDCVETRIPKNSFETIYPTLSLFTPSFCKRLFDFSAPGGATETRRIKEILSRERF